MNKKTSKIHVNLPNIDVEELALKLKHVKPEWRNVMRLRFGIGKGQKGPLSLTQVAIIKGVTRERIRQIQVRVFERLDIIERNG